MEITTVNQIIAACSGLGGALIGAGITGWVNRSISETNFTNEVNSFKAGFVAEVESLQNVIRARNYLKNFEEYAEHPEILKGGTATFSILIPDNYARFYNANLNKVGLMGPELAKQLIQYHQLLQALVQDFKPDSHVSIYGYNKESIDECIRIMKYALSLGDQIVSSSA